MHPILSVCHPLAAHIGAGLVGNPTVVAGDALIAGNGVPEQILDALPGVAGEQIDLRIDVAVEVVDLLRKHDANS